MYGQGSGPLASNVTGVSGLTTTVAGIAVLPNTGGNVILTVFSIATIAIGTLIVASFGVTRVMSRLSR